MAALTFTVATVGSAGASQADERKALAANRALWAQRDIRDYRFRLRVRCFCPDAAHAVTITVRDGKAHGASGYQKQLDTVPEMFAAIRRTLDDPDAGETSVSYDAKRGFPRRASLDRIENAIDDEIGWTIRRFRVLEPRSPGG